LVEVHAVSLDFGELAYLQQQRRPGEVPGDDAAGIVVRPVADGSGPPVGTRVVSFDFQGGWAELRAVDTADLAVLPDSVEFGAASTLPAAGVTALQALRRLGPVEDRRVLITGASGGVGRFAVQLAALGGARVVASVGSPARGGGWPISALRRSSSASAASPNPFSACSTTSEDASWPKDSPSSAIAALR
jgi:NADPH:quinone reductase-like Zn-dependent oxidoreductase